MNCPVDETTLVLADRAGIEIDYCPTCRGVWLDRGELDKIIERDAGLDSTNPNRAGRRDHDDDDDDHDDDDRVHASRSGTPKRKRKSSFLGDLFEFGG